MMTPSTPPTVHSSPARLLVNGVHAFRARKLGISAIALLLTLVFSSAYLVFGTLQIDPTQSRMRISVLLRESGGLLAGQDATLRGVKIGSVDKVDLSSAGVVAEVSIDADSRIPADTPVDVASLSLAGEQFLDFRPASSTGPYLADGDSISEERTTTPVTLTTVLTDANGLIEQIEPDQVKTIVRELGSSTDGPEKLASIIDGGTFLISTLDEVLPETVQLLNSSKVVLGTFADMGEGLATTSRNLSTTLAGVEPMTDGFKTLLAQGPPVWRAMDNIIADNSPTMVQLLGNLVTTTQMAYLRAPALSEFFFPTARNFSTIDALSSAFHDGSFWALANIYPRYSCDKNVPRPPTSDASYAEIHKYGTCTNEDPTILPRGARNAPRPDGVPIPGVPDGADPMALTDPTPIGPETIPTPPGGGYVQ